MSDENETSEPTAEAVEPIVQTEPTAEVVEPIAMAADLFDVFSDIAYRAIVERVIQLFIPRLTQSQIVRKFNQLKRGE